MGSKGIEIARDISVDEHKVENYYIYHTNKGFQFVTLAKHSFWNIWYIDEVKAADKDDVISVCWFGQSSWSRFVENTDVKAETNFDMNYVYIGNNASDLLQLNSQDIPGDVCIKINQIQEAYWIWVISDNMDAINQLQILEKLQLIPAS